MAESFERIAERFYKANQSWHYEWVGKRAGERFRIRIRRNAYDDQSHAVGEALSFSACRWEPVVERPMTPELPCYGASYLMDAERADLAAFRATAALVRTELLALWSNP